jgi:uncharacterized membrane protein YfcA
VITGVLSGWGVGGGTLLMIYLTVFQNMSQTSARGINLVYFLFSSAGALFYHIKNRFVDKTTALWAMAAGAVFAVLAALCASVTNPDILKKLFGGFLIAVGISELFKKNSNKPSEK